MHGNEMKTKRKKKEEEEKNQSNDKIIAEYDKNYMHEMEKYTWKCERIQGSTKNPLSVVIMHNDWLKIESICQLTLKTFLCDALFIY